MVVMGDHSKIVTARELFQHTNYVLNAKLKQTFVFLLTLFKNLYRGARKINKSQ